MSVAIVDYGSGNLRSAAKAFERAAGPKTKVTVTARAADLAEASHIVLPGVGAFADCMAGLAGVKGMVEALEENVIGARKPFLGICVGMQLMAERGLEHGTHRGLGWIGGEVRRVEPSDKSLKIPHMGWNDVSLTQTDHPVLAGLANGDHVYFVHSYQFVCADPAQMLATVDYGGAVTAIVGRDNMLGTQFHPEKSQKVGLDLIANFLQWKP
ncbi:MAG: imidazole glycerol phosphate synthase subunit HisH [Alphaproteobacteria bacterium]